MRHLLLAVYRSDLVQGSDRGGDPTMDAENLKKKSVGDNDTQNPAQVGIYHTSPSTIADKLR